MDIATLSEILNLQPRRKNEKDSCNSCVLRHCSTGFGANEHHDNRDTTTQDPVVSQGDATTTTTTSSAEGMVTTFSPGQTLVVREVGVTDPVSYSLGNTVVYVDRNGKTIEVSRIHSGIPVHVYYDKSGKTRKVTKIVVDQN